MKAAPTFPIAKWKGWSSSNSSVAGIRTRNSLRNHLLMDTQNGPSTKKGKKPGTGSDNGRPEKALAKIPNVAGVVKRIKSALKSHFYNNLTTFKPIGTLRSKLVKVKDKMPREKLSNLVYGIPCGSQRCAATNVGETKQSLRARLDQHRHKGSNEAQISAVCLHCKETCHSFKNTDVVILDREED